MDHRTANQDGEQPANNSSNPAEAVSASSTIPQDPQAAAAADTAPTFGSIANPVSHWSDTSVDSGSVAASVAPTVSSQGVVNSSTYSGQDANVATANAVDLSAARVATAADAQASSGQAPRSDSADFVSVMSQVDPIDLGMVLSSGARRRAIKFNKEQKE